VIRTLLEYAVESFACPMASPGAISLYIQSKWRVLSQVKGSAPQFCWPFFVAFKEYALWTSFEIEAIMGTGFDRCDLRKDGNLG
jgi:hypothetical protein